MPPIVTLPPVSVTLEEGNWASDNFAGPYPLNGALYVISGSTSTGPLIYKSTDEGLTYSLVALTPFGGASADFFRYYWNPLDGDTITFMFRVGGAGNSVQLQNLDLDAEAYGAVYGAVGGPVIGTTNQGMVLARTPNGNVKVFYISAPETLYYSANVGGAWTVVDTAIVANPGNAFTLNARACCADTNNGTPFIYGYNVGTTRHVTYQYLSSTNVLGTLYDLPFAFVNQGSRPIFRIYQGTNGNLYMSELTYNQGPSAPTGIGMWTGTGSLAAPTWAETQVFDFDTLSDTYTTVFTFATEVSGAQTIFAVVDKGLAFAINTTLLYYSTLNAQGFWTTPTLYYDPDVAPPPYRTRVGSNYYLEGLSFTSSPYNGLGFGVVITIDIRDDDGNSITPPFYLLNPAITLTQPGGGVMRSLPCIYDDFDRCLYREFLTYQGIARERIACARIPDCFAGGHIE